MVGDHVCCVVLLPGLSFSSSVLTRYSQRAVFPQCAHVSRGCCHGMLSSSSLRILCLLPQDQSFSMKSLATAQQSKTWWWPSSGLARTSHAPANTIAEVEAARPPLACSRGALYMI